MKDYSLVTIYYYNGRRKQLRCVNDVLFDNYFLVPKLHWYYGKDTPEDKPYNTGAATDYVNLIMEIEMDNVFYKINREHTNDLDLFLHNLKTEGALRNLE